MSTLSPKFSVVLRPNLPPKEYEFFEQFCCKITQTNEPPLLHFLCTDLQFENHHFLLMDTFKPDDSKTHAISLPYQYVLLISGADDQHPMGFASPSG